MRWKYIPHELPSDLKIEDEIVKRVEKAWGGKISPNLGKELKFDRLWFHSNRPIAWVEIRNRKNKMHHYKTFGIGLHKIGAAKQWHRCTLLETRLVVQWTDQLGWINIIRTNGLLTPYTKEIGGSFAHRGDPNDVEPWAYFELKEFKIID